MQVFVPIDAMNLTILLESSDNIVFNAQGYLSGAIFNCDDPIESQPGVFEYRNCKTMELVGEMQNFVDRHFGFWRQPVTVTYRETSGVFSVYPSVSVTSNIRLKYTEITDIRKCNGALETVFATGIYSFTKQEFDTLKNQNQLQITVIGPVSGNQYTVTASKEQSDYTVGPYLMYENPSNNTYPNLRWVAQLIINPDGNKIVMGTSDVQYTTSQTIGGKYELHFSGIGNLLINVPNTTLQSNYCTTQVVEVTYPSITRTLNTEVQYIQPPSVLHQRYEVGLNHAIVEQSSVSYAQHKNTNIKSLVALHLQRAVRIESTAKFQNTKTEKSLKARVARRVKKENISLNNPAILWFDYRIKSTYEKISALLYAVQVKFKDFLTGYQINAKIIISSRIKDGISLQSAQLKPVYSKKVLFGRPIVRIENIVSSSKRLRTGVDVSVGMNFTFEDVQIMAQHISGGLLNNWIYINMPMLKWEVLNETQVRQSGPLQIVRRWFKEDETWVTTGLRPSLRWETT